MRWAVGMDLDTSLDSGLTHACGCSSCTAAENGVMTQMVANTDVSGAVSMPSGDLDPTATADDILTGYSHGSGNGSPITITYKFHANYESYWAQDGSFQYNTSGMSAFSTAQRNATNDILDLIESFTNITFQEVSGSTNPAIGFINANASDGSTTLGGSAYYPTGWAGAGDVFINKLFWGYNSGASEGDVNYYILLHEIGHALGLEHTFSAGLTGAQNTEQYSVMAYDNSPWGNLYAESYQLFDIYSLQQLYGANTSYNSGNTVYTLQSGRAYTIWDGGGTDTLDGSHLSAGMTINLDAGTFSSVGQTNNIAIAYGTTIENANGGSGDDVIYGNDANNVIDGNGGNDTIYASAGNDTLIGDGGTDEVIYSSNISNFIFTFVDAVTVRIEDIVGSFGTDTVSFFEDFTFSGTTYDYAGLQANGTPAVVEPILMKLFWSGGKDNIWSSGIANTTYSAADLGYGSASGNILSVNRTNSDLTITMLQNVQLDNLRIDGTDQGDNFTINGSHSDLGVIAYGGGGNDTITVSVSGDDELWGGSGDDTLSGGNGDDRLYGEAGIDTLNGGSGVDRLYGGTGNDILNGGNNGDILFGNEGEDELNGDAGNDKLYGLQDNDTLNGGVGRDLLYGDEGEDILNGGNDNDRLFGGIGNDTLNGDAGVDRLYGENGDDILNGGSGNDKLYGHAGNDTLNGDADKDQLYGLDNDDRLNGGSGNDLLYGGDGVDTLVGGSGKDFLYGEGGSDIFGFTSFDGSIDSLQDFTLNGAARDSINITDLLSGFNQAVDNINDFVALTFKNSSRTDLSINTDGVGNDWVKIAFIKGDNLSGVDANDLLISGQLITDQTLL